MKSLASHLTVALKRTGLAKDVRQKMQRDKGDTE